MIAVTQEGWDGVERRRADIEGSLRGVKAGLEELVLAVKMAFPEERVREIVAYEQARTRRRTVAAILGPVLLALVVVFTQARLNSNTLSEAKVTADFVRDCIQHPERLTVTQRQDRCGGTGETGASQAVRALIGFQKCALLILPEARTDANLNNCIAVATKDLGG